MHKAGYTHIISAAAASAALILGAAGIAGASTDTTEPAEPAHTGADHTGADHTAAEVPTPTAGEPTSPEAEAFCAAEVAVEAAFNSEDPAAIGPAVEALTAATPADLMPSVEALVAAGDPESPEFAEAYGAIIEWMKANCGFVQVNASASEYAFEGLPSELPAGGTIITLENVGEEVHEIALMRISDDVTLTLEELLALPEEETEGMATFVGIAFAFPGTSSSTVLDLTPGRYVALCFLPEGATPEVLTAIEEAGGGPEDTIPPGFDVGPPHFTHGMFHEFTVV